LRNLNNYTGDDRIRMFNNGTAVIPSIIVCPDLEIAPDPASCFSANPGWNGKWKLAMKDGPSS